MLVTLQNLEKEGHIPENRTMEEVFNSSKDLNGFIDNMPAWVQVCSLDGMVELANRAALEISGYQLSEMVGQQWPHPWFEKGEPSSAGYQSWWTGPWPYAELERNGRVCEFEATCTTRQGSTRVLGVTLSLVNDDQNQPGHILMVGWDLTERKVREAELGQAQKLQAVGQLASGIAHDINNNLAVILGYSEFLLGTSESFGDVVRQALAAIQDQSMDCANTVRRIQMFSRAVPRSQFSSFSVNDVIHEVMRAADVLGSARTGGKGSGIRVETHLAELSPVWAYRAGVKEALSNLVDNAVEALPEGGVISVKTSVREDDVVLEVSDNGVGIAPADVNRIFDAFFTTRGPASSGLGLSIAYNLITKQGGRISVASCPGEGTTFTIGLPNRTANASDSVIDDISGKRKGLSVLVIDDEPLVAEVFRTFLEASGNRVATCSNGSNGLEVFDQQQFDLALVDLGMPNIDGWEVSRRINRLRPDFPIIVATGWNVSVEDGREQGAQVRAVLKKPFGIQELDQAIEEALDGALV